MISDRELDRIPSLSKEQREVVGERFVEEIVAQENFCENMPMSLSTHRINKLLKE
jgi:hypothetical protein